MDVFLRPVRNLAYLRDEGVASTGKCGDIGWISRIVIQRFPQHRYALIEVVLPGAGIRPDLGNEAATGEAVPMIPGQCHKGVKGLRGQRNRVGPACEAAFDWIKHERAEFV